ncbi:MAG TPA: urea transporter [Flavobacteriaceae bacterium]|nr:urea transporter [Flavobacteriaceae bacterium]
MKFLSVILRGLGQIMLQNNILSGLFFLIGLSLNSPIMAGAALLGTILNTISAYIFKADPKEIADGIHGFNGALIGIAVWTFFEIDVFSIAAIVVGSILAVPTLQFIQRLLPPFTAPFVLLTWILILTLTFLFKFLLPESESGVADSADLLLASANGFGQVMFQENVLTGVMFLIGILINSRISALYALYASVMGALVTLLFVLPTPSINAGLMGYNAILCAIALGAEKRNRLLWISLSIVFSVILHAGLSSLGIIPLTAPFVLSTWIFLWIRSKSNSLSTKIRRENKIE